MSSGVESAALIEPWLYSRLTGDTALTAIVADRVFGPLTPDEILSPYVTFSLSSLRDIMGIGIARISVDALYLVKVVAQTTSLNDVAPAAARVEALLHGAIYDGVDGSLTCVRNNVVDYTEVSDGSPYRHLGAVFRIRANT